MKRGKMRDPAAALQLGQLAGLQAWARIHWSAIDRHACRPDWRDTDAIRASNFSMRQPYIWKIMSSTEKQPCVCKVWFRRKCLVATDRLIWIQEQLNCWNQKSCIYITNKYSTTKLSSHALTGSPCLCLTHSVQFWQKGRFSPNIVLVRRLDRRKSSQ